MQYTQIRKAVFLKRPNRFIAEIEIDGNTQICHVKNTGRCRELLLPGTTVYVQDFGEERTRKTRYDLICVEKRCENGTMRLINMDSQVPNKVCQEWLLEGNLFPADEPITLLKPEFTFGDSRFDFYFETPKRRCFAEVKGVTLETDGVVAFPDAPTERGVKHLQGLMRAVEQGYEAYVIFIIQMKNVLYFTPNAVTHAAFANTLCQAQQAGVHLLALDCTVTPDTIVAGDPVAIRFPDLLPDPS